MRIAKFPQVLAGAASITPPVFATSTLPTAGPRSHALTTRRRLPAAVTAEAAVSTPETSPAAAAVALATSVAPAAIAVVAAPRAFRWAQDSRNDRRDDRWRRHRSWRWDQNWQWRGRRSGTRHPGRDGCRRRSGHRSRRWDRRRGGGGRDQRRRRRGRNMPGGHHILGKAGPRTDRRSNTERQRNHQCHNAYHKNNHHAHRRQERRATRLPERCRAEVGVHAGGEVFFLVDISVGVGTRLGVNRR